MASPEIAIWLKENVFKCLDLLAFFKLKAIILEGEFQCMDKQCY